MPALVVEYREPDNRSCRGGLGSGLDGKVTMTKRWKAVVLVSLSLNLVCFLVIADVGERLVNAQLENLSLFMKLSADQQALRRDLNAAKATFDHTR
jgi:hypothetical protein